MPINGGYPVRLRGGIFVGLQCLLIGCRGKISEIWRFIANQFPNEIKFEHLDTA